MKTFKIDIEAKEPDLFFDLCSKLELTAEMRDKHFLFGEYATFQIELDENLNIVSGRILPVKP